MKPSVWGNHYWFVIHITAKKYPFNPTEEDKHAFKEFYQELWRFLPCKICSDHYKEHLAYLPIETYLGSSDKLFEWTVLLHNKVNASLSKPPMSLRDAFEYYDFPDGGVYQKSCDLRKEHQQSPHLNVLMIMNLITIIVIVCILIYLWWALKNT